MLRARWFALVPTAWAILACGNGMPIDLGQEFQAPMEDPPEAEIPEFPEAVALDDGLEAALVELLGARDPGASICPSEVARAEAASWRPLLEHARRAGRRLASTGIVQFTQGGRVVDPGRARGPVRIRRGPAWGRAGR